MQSSQGVIPRNNADASLWEHATGFQRGLIPSPNNTPLQVMHKAERKYEVGKVSDTEEAKQRQLKHILNKLTPQNFARLFQQVMEVNIDSLVTLTGLVSQIFDRALTEPTFCTMYVNFCSHLAAVLPNFTDENDKLITFRRLLLNKCQDQFERGEREQAEAEKVEGESEIKQSEQEREEKRLRARRRKLGNIRLIGELFKKKMLTERIMHECIKNLIGLYQSPAEEDIEALCILMATIGEMIDHSKAKVQMDAYFDMMHKRSTNNKISYRVRFMLRDSIDLRKNKWQQRRKVEAPKKIEDVHRDATQERPAVVNGGGGNRSSMTRGGRKGGRPSFEADMAQKSQLRVVCNRSGTKVSGGEGNSPGIRREPAPSYHSYSDTHDGEEKQVHRNNGEMGNFTRDRPVLDISSSSSSGEDEMEEWLVGKKNTGLLASASSIKERRDEDDECVIMDSNLFQTPVVDFKHKLSLSDDNLSRFQDEEFAVISERGHVACRDYPHSRHHCAKFPFNKTIHESCCPQCYCYVCDRVAPCKYWKGSSGHCHASDEDPKWKGMRMFHRGSLAEAPPADYTVAPSTHLAPSPVMILAPHEVSTDLALAPATDSMVDFSAGDPLSAQALISQALTSQRIPLDTSHRMDRPFAAQGKNFQVLVLHGTHSAPSHGMDCSHGSEVCFHGSKTTHKTISAADAPQLAPDMALCCAVTAPEVHSADSLAPPGYQTAPGSICLTWKEHMGYFAPPIQMKDFQYGDIPTQTPTCSSRRSARLRLRHRRSNR